MTGARLLGLLAWPEVPASGTLLILPVGSTEQHGPHLPVATDTIVAEELARRLGASMDSSVVAPPLPYGSSGEHAGFPGTLSIGQEALEAVVVELVRSAEAFAATAVVSAHGGNAEALGRAAHRLRAEGRPILVWSPRVEVLTAPSRPGGRRVAPGSTVTGTELVDAHAGAVETSMILHLRPELVGPIDARAGTVTTPIGQLLPRLRREGVRAVSPSGVLGDPGRASAERGRQIIEALAADLQRQVEAWWSSLEAGRSANPPADRSPT